MNPIEPRAADKAKKKKRKGFYFEPLNDKTLTAFKAAIMSVSERAVEELNCGKLKRILIEGAEGTIIISKTGENAVTRTFPKNTSNKILYCKYCGNNLIKKDKICPICGNKVM
ncbi:MAG: roadblock/LC7 domain-containing protein [Promethearchaeota archaeon]